MNVLDNVHARRRLMPKAETPTADSRQPIAPGYDSPVVQTSLSHLPERKQADIASIVELIHSVVREHG